MSQTKVDNYKEEKANRRRLRRKHRLYNLMRKCLVVFVGVILLGWITYSAYHTYEAKQSRPEVEITVLCRIFRAIWIKQKNKINNKNQRELMFKSVGLRVSTLFICIQ